jgi:hypothetical protein
MDQRDRGVKLALDDELPGGLQVLHTLRPFAVAMAGEGEFDPFKD